MLIKRGDNSRSGSIVEISTYCMGAITWYKHCTKWKNTVIPLYFLMMVKFT